MKRKLLGRGLLILGLLVLSVYFIIPPEERINLGLDLRGGMHLMLQVKTEDALRAETDADMQRVVQQAAEKDVTGLAPRRTGDAAFEVAGAAPETKEVLSQIGRDFLPAWDVQDRGDRMAFTMKPGAVAEIRELAVNQAVQTIRNRVDAFGVAEPVIVATTDQRIVVQLPGVDDPDRVRRLIKNTAFLEFRLVRGGPAPSREQLQQGLSPDQEILEQDSRDAEGKVTGTEYYAVDKQRVITGRDLKIARQGQGRLGEPVVNFSLTPEGSRVFGDVTGKNIGTGLAIVLDGKIVSAPVIRAKITDSGVIEGRFTQQEAEDLSTVLRSGALPAGITYLEERTVGPSLGRDAIEQGLRAGVVGTVLVVIFIMIVYNLTGLNAVFALILNIVLLFGGLGFFHSTLTLPGIAGIILTIGMAIDANVLVFERIREELRAGRTVRSAIDLGFERALSSIVDSNVTTLISALFLFQFGTGPIRGFAVTLTIGLLASMFTAVVVSRWMFDVVLSRRRVERLSI